MATTTSALLGTTAVGGAWSGMCSTKIDPNDRPTFAELLLPPLIMFLIIVFGLIYLMVSNTFEAARMHKKFLRSLKQDVICTEKDIDSRTDRVEEILKDEWFYSSFDLEVKQGMKKYFNTYRELAIIAAPSIAATILSSFLLLLKDTMLRCFWPQMAQPYINTAISCFLMPAGFVFALSFGFMFQQAMTKQTGIVDKVTQEMSMLDQILSLTERFVFPDKRFAMAIYKAVKTETIYLMLQLQNRNLEKFKNPPREPVTVQIWSIIDIIREASLHHEYTFGVNRILSEHIVSYLIQLNNICCDRIGALHSRIHPVKWVFLLALALFTLFGIIFLDASSPSMECAMNQITVFSTSMLCFVLSDLDSPFNGFFRVDVSVLPEVICRAEKLYIAAQMQIEKDLSLSNHKKIFIKEANIIDKVSKI